MNKKILFVFGTRPEAIKMAPVILEIKKHPESFTPKVVVTGQHREMLAQVLNLFEIKPDHDLKIMEENQSLTSIIVKSLQGLEKIIQKEKPDMLMIQGDTSTTFAASLSSYYHKIPLGHVEAGLRTFDKWKPYPEEINRKLTSALADLHLAPTKGAVNNLISEGVSKDSIYLTGNTVIDALLKVAVQDYNLSQIGIKVPAHKKIVLVTVHRRESFGKSMKEICLAVRKIAEKYSKEVKVIIPVHKNPSVRSTVYKILEEVKNIQLIEPLDYEPFVHLMKASYLILTDSGGIQEEAPTLGKPVLVLRERTERPEAIASGGVKLVGVKEKDIFEETDKLLQVQAEYAKMVKVVNPYGDGKASQRIIGVLLYYFGFTDILPQEFKCGNF